MSPQPFMCRSLGFVFDQRCVNSFSVWFFLGVMLSQCGGAPCFLFLGYYKMNAWFNFGCAEMKNDIDTNSKLFLGVVLTFLFNKRNVKKNMAVQKHGNVPVRWGR